MNDSSDKLHEAQDCIPYTHEQVPKMLYDFCYTIEEEIEESNVDEATKTLMQTFLRRLNETYGQILFHVTKQLK